MVHIPLPKAGNVTLVISDGTFVQAAEVTREDLLGDYDRIQSALDYLDAEMISRAGNKNPLQQGIADVTQYREQRDKDG
jgi:hypothetical protein